MGQSAGSRRIPGPGMGLVGMNVEPSGRSAAFLGPILALPQRKVSLCQEDTEDN